MKNINRILTLNFDFRYLSSNSSLKVVEVNADKLSRYSIVQKLNFFPRKFRYNHIVQRAENNKVDFSILYNPEFHTNQEKGLRWGFDPSMLADQKNIYAATEENLVNLKKKLQKNNKKNWVLLLGVHSITNIYSHLISDQHLCNSRFQTLLQSLFEEKNHNTVFIGEDIAFDRISNDKFLTSRFLPNHFQPKSTLVINGIDPNEAQKQLNSVFHSDHLIIKPLNGHSGLGIYELKNKTDIQYFLSIMSRAKLSTERSKLKMKLALDHPLKYLINSQGNNPFLQIQEFATTNEINNRQITYRAVATVYIDINNNFEIDIECIYPKKSNPGDFKSRVENEISFSEFEAVMKDGQIKAEILKPIKFFVEKITSYNDNRLINDLLKEDDPIFLKGLQMLTSTKAQNSLYLPDFQLKAKKLAQNLFITSPQAFLNTKNIFKSLNLKFLELKNESTYYDNLILENPLFFSDQERKMLVKKREVDNCNKSLTIEFLQYCQQLRNALRERDYNLYDHLTFDPVYEIIRKLTFCSEKLITINYFFQLIIVINFFELRTILYAKYPYLKNVFRVKIESEDSIILLFQLNDETDFKAIDNEKLVKGLIRLSNISQDISDHFPKSLKGLALSDYLLQLSSILYYRYSINYLKRSNPYSSLYSLHAFWYGIEKSQLEEFGYTHLDWVLMSQNIKLLDLGIQEIMRNKNLTANFAIKFVCRHLSEPLNKISFVKCIELITYICCKLPKVNPKLYSKLSYLLSNQMNNFKFTNTLDSEMENLINQLLTKLNDYSNQEKKLFQADNKTTFLNNARNNNNNKKDHIQGNISHFCSGWQLK